MDWLSRDGEEIWSHVGLCYVALVTVSEFSGDRYTISVSYYG